MKEVSYESTLFDYSDAIINDEFTGFKEDYLILHSLIRKYKPDTFFEIGTNMGTGTNIICNAMSVSIKIKDEIEHANFHLSVISEDRLIYADSVFSLDLPTELAHISLQHPISEGKGDNVGSRCTFPFTQLRGDSKNFKFSQYPCQGYWVDAEHKYDNVLIETIGITSVEPLPKLIAYHDTDIPEVMQAIQDALPYSYDLFRVTGTRVSYAILK